MKIALVILAALMGTTIYVDATHPSLFSDEYIKQINSKAKTWVAGRNFPENTTLDYLKKLLGAKLSNKPTLKYKLAENLEDVDIPESFDARQQWANCTSISLIRDQSSCGSCWAIGASSVMSDRICVQSNGQKQTQISAIDILSCCKTCGHGCGGGYPDITFKHWMETGIVSGGEYESENGCKPYPYPKCGGTKYPACLDDFYTVPMCSKKCSNNNLEYSRDLHKATSAYTLPNDAKQIQKEIMTHGPVEAIFNVYMDFYNYKSGVYQRTPGFKCVGRHAVRVIGWGVENGLPYWLVTNSWNESWGDNGLFKIRRGNNECAFETQMIAGIPEN